MHSFIQLAGFIALASAIPHAHKHLRTHSHAPHNIGISLAGRDTLPTDQWTGRCGGDTGLGCAPGSCCSKYGYCGTTLEYCAEDICRSAACSSVNSTGPSSPPAISAANAQNSSSIDPVTVHNAPPTYSVTIQPPAYEASTTLLTQYNTASTSSTSAFSTSTISTSARSTPPVSTSAAQITTETTPAYTQAPSNDNSNVNPGLGDSYKLYVGNGETSSGWPAESSWKSFDSLWSDNLPILASSCTNFGVPSNSDEELSNLRSAISSISQSSGVDSRFVLAIALQESGGCVRAPTTSYSVQNPGVMQTHNGAGSCNMDGNIQNPCPMSEITQMIRDGVEGTADGDGLKQTLEKAGCDDVSKYYKAARIYNSGSISGDDLGAGVATRCYAADIGNRLTGWVNAPKECHLDTKGKV